MSLENSEEGQLVPTHRRRRKPAQPTRQRALKGKGSNCTQEETAAPHQNTMEKQHDQRSTVQNERGAKQHHPKGRQQKTAPPKERGEAAPAFLPLPRPLLRLHLPCLTDLAESRIKQKRRRSKRRIGEQQQKQKQRDGLSGCAFPQENQ